jgi:hypothetical protein
MLENEGMLGKGDFDRMEGLLGDWRKEGLIPLDWVGRDDKRAPQNEEVLDSQTPEEYAQTYVKIAAECDQDYKPLSFWEFQPCYIEMAVEKTDLRHLFGPVCAEFHIMIWNAGGWSDINSRADLLIRFQEHDAAGRQCILLYCGDFDPWGQLISDVIRKNLKDVEKAVGWFPDEDRLIIDRFGLNEDFITANSLLWIDGLETGSGKNLADKDHHEHDKEHVQKWLKTYGARKVEANALVVRPEEGRQLCRDAIEKYIDRDGIRRYEAALKTERRKVKKALPGAFRAMLKGGNGHI